MVEKKYTWHGQPCIVLIHPTFKRGHCRNGLIEIEGEKIVVPFRALRLVKEVSK